MESKVTGKLEECWEAWTSGLVTTVDCWSGSGLAVALMSGSLPIFLIESECSEALESFLARGRAVQRRRKARATLSSASHSSSLTHIWFTPESANRLKLTPLSHSMTQSFFSPPFTFFFLGRGGGCLQI